MDGIQALVMEIEAGGGAEGGTASFRAFAIVNAGEESQDNKMLESAYRAHLPVTKQRERSSQALQENKRQRTNLLWLAFIHVAPAFVRRRDPVSWVARDHPGWLNRAGFDAGSDRGPDDRRAP
jgi:hypothetical protein